MLQMLARWALIRLSSEIFSILSTYYRNPIIVMVGRMKRHFSYFPQMPFLAVSYRLLVLFLALSLSSFVDGL